MEVQYIRGQLAKAVRDFRGTRSRAFLRGMAAAAKICFAGSTEICPYDTWDPQKEEFWSGNSTGIDLIKEVTVYRSNNVSEIEAQFQVSEHPQVPQVAAHRALTPWEPEEIRELLELYHDDFPINDLAKTFSRTDNAIVWQLWSEAANSMDLLERMELKGHTCPPRRGDLRNQNEAFRWVAAYLRGASKLMRRRNQDVSLDALLAHAAGSLASWPPRGYNLEAAEIERNAAIWMFNHPERWFGRENW